MQVACYCGGTTIRASVVEEVSAPAGLYVKLTRMCSVVLVQSRRQIRFLQNPHLVAELYYWSARGRQSVLALRLCNPWSLGGVLEPSPRSAKDPEMRSSFSDPAAVTECGWLKQRTHKKHACALILSRRAQRPTISCVQGLTSFALAPRLSLFPGHGRSEERAPISPLP